MDTNPKPNVILLVKRTRKSTLFDLRFIWPPTYFDLRRLWSSSNSRTQVEASFSPSGHPTQVDSQVNCIYVRFTFSCDLRELASRLVNLFGHPSQVRTQVLRVLQTCGVDLHRLASPFDQNRLKTIERLIYCCEIQVPPKRWRWKQLALAQYSFIAKSSH